MGDRIVGPVNHVTPLTAPSCASCAKLAAELAEARADAGALRVGRQLARDRADRAEAVLERAREALRAYRRGHDTEFRARYAKMDELVECDCGECQQARVALSAPPAPEAPCEWCGGHHPGHVHKFLDQNVTKSDDVLVTGKSEPELEEKL